MLTHMDKVATDWQAALTRYSAVLCHIEYDMHFQMALSVRASFGCE